MATHSSILTWRIPWTEEPSVLQSMGSQRVGHNWSNLACMQKKSVYKLPHGGVGQGTGEWLTGLAPPGVSVKRSHSGQYQVSEEVGRGFSMASVGLSLKGAWCPECPCETE